MGANSDISWTHHTLNPWWGCAHVSEGCRNCYAEALNARWKRAEWGVGSRRWFPSEAYLRQPLAWDASCAARGVRERVFAASMADVFEDHPAVVDARAALFALIARTPNLDWLLLTKRPQNIAAMLPPDWGAGYPNVVLMTTVEDNRVIARIDALRAVPAARRGLSVEPMIGPVALDGIDWVICGGESGPHARGLDLIDVRDVIAATRAAGAAIHVKQLGSVWSKEAGDGAHQRDPHGADQARFPLDLRVREYPRALTAARVPV